MKTVINGVTFDIDDQAAEALAQERKTAQATADTLTGERDAARKKTLTDAEIDALVNKRLAEREAATAAANLRKVVRDAGYEVEGKSDEYIQGIASTLDTDANGAKSEGSETVDAGVKIAAGVPKTGGTIDARAAMEAAKRKQYRG